LTAELQGRRSQAEGFYRRALELQRSKQRPYPVTHFITLWRLAGLADQGGRRAEARRLLEEAVGVVEAARLRTYGDAQQRATFFAQFEPGFEQLVDWCVRVGDVEAAFRAAARSRSRSLLDQLQLAGADPRAALRGPRGKQLRQREEELRRQISRLRARARLIPAEDVERSEVKELLTALDQAQQRYAEVWREVLNASPVYRSLSAEDPARTALATLRDHVLGPRTLLLAYHIGREHSYLLLLGDRSTRPEAFPLTVPPGAAQHPVTPASSVPEASREGERGVSVRPRFQPGPAVPAAPVPAGDTVPLNQLRARVLVDRYLAQIARRGFASVRDLELKPSRPDRAGSFQGPDLLGKVLLPPAVRRRIREFRPEYLVVIPDGPLHKLPLEALVLEASPVPRFGLDELPPIAYAPSAAVLALLAERSRRAPAGPLSLLTVSDPAYAQGAAATPASARPTLRHVLGLGGQLVRLPGTAEESRRISRFFDRSQVTALERARATKRAVKEAMDGKRVIHLAAHGLADERLGNLFGALALTPPPPGGEAADDDGFLSLHEIYTLPLKDCELAVLSACKTNVGPQRPLEAGVTLASGFLAAGARRVVASHWSVADKSTAALMEAFFKEVTAATERGERVSYARALRKARLKVRNTAQWSAPFYWAPFVLIGPAE
jgi:CHAT domain-containing protein